MRDLDKALADILAIRNQIAAGTAFRGYGPAAVASTAGLAAVTTGLQLVFLDDANATPILFVAGWLVTALIAAALIGVEMRARSQRHHSGLADAMIYQAVEQMLPSGVAGVALAAVALQFAPETLWMLPGLWQLLMGLAVFASARSLAGHGAARRGLVLRRRRHRADAGKPHAGAVTAADGRAVRDRPVADGGDPLCRQRR